MEYRAILLSALLAITVESNLEAATADGIIRVDPGSNAPLASLGEAPNFIGISEWFNSKPLTMQSLRGKVVILEFWTYSCINCLRSLDYLKHWNETYKDKGLVVIGVHTPEYPFETDPQNVQEAISRYGITYPVASDVRYETWNAYKNRFWPTTYLIDKNGVIRKKHIGEGGYTSMENAIRQLLSLEPLNLRRDNEFRFRVLTPEIHLGFQRAANYANEIRLEPNQIASYSYKEQLPANQVGLNGKWQVTKDAITAVGPDSTIGLNFLAGRVYIVLSGQSTEPVKVLLDGQPLPKKYYTDDMDAQGYIYVEADGKYDLINLHGSVERHSLTVTIPSGISAYEFSFGLEN